VDTDLRKPVIHRIFECKRSPGLVNVLVEEDWQQALDQTIQPTQIQHLDFLACGDVPPNPNEMLGSEKMGQVIQHLGGRYDFVLFDSPPLLSVSDAAVLAQRLDGVLLVVRGGRTPRSVLKDVAEMLRKARSEILGVVLNGIDFKRERYYYYYRHYYAYGDGNKTPEPRGKFAFIGKFFNRKPGSVEDRKQ
jgi:capsular exopolysaccharide synthesis family protein